MFRSLTLAALLLVSPTLAQDNGCPPRMPKPLETTRLAQLDEATGMTTVLTVSEGLDAGRSLTAVYENPAGDYTGNFTMDGTIEWTNNTAVQRRMKMRQIIQLDVGIVPIIPAGFGEVCWEASTQRLITVYEQIVDANQTVNTPIFWEVVTRLEGQLADVNSDGWVDGADQGLIMAAFGTDNPLYDLNQDGIVNGADLGILFTQWSESFDDQIEANAGGGGVEEDPIEPPVEVVDVDFNPLWESADEIIILTLNELPTDTTRAGHFILPKVQWRLM